MQRSFYLIFLSVLLSFSFSNDSFAAVALVSKAEILPSQTISKKQEKKLTKFKAKFQKLQKQKSWKLIAFSLISGLLAGLAPLIIFSYSLMQAFLLPILVTSIGIFLFLILKTGHPKSSKFWIILAIIINLSVFSWVAFLGIILRNSE